MERRYPKIGKVALLISLSQFAAVVLNGLLGVFPAGIIGTAVRGQKFHLLQFLRQQLNLPYKSNGFWSDAGLLTGQEYAMLSLMVVTLIIAIIGLRERQQIEGPKSMSAEEQREQLESGNVPLSRPGGLSVVNPTTAAIVSSVVGGDATPTAEVIANALGEMSVVAQEMGVDDFLIKGEIIQEEVDESTIDSRFTTSVGDEDDVVDLVGVVSTTEHAGTTEDVLSGTPIEMSSADEGEDDDLGWLDESPVSRVTTSDSDPSSAVREVEPPRLPQRPAKKFSRVEPVSPPKRTALTATTTGETLGTTPKSATDGSTRAGFSGSIPNKPTGLPAMAEYDMQTNQWMLFGKAIEFTDTPPAPPAPLSHPPQIPAGKASGKDVKNYLRPPKVPQTR